MYPPAFYLERGSNVPSWRAVTAVKSFQKRCSCTSQRPIILFNILKLLFYIFYSVQAFSAELFCPAFCPAPRASVFGSKIPIPPVKQEKTRVHLHFYALDTLKLFINKNGAGRIPLVKRKSGLLCFAQHFAQHESGYVQKNWWWKSKRQYISIYFQKSAHIFSTGKSRTHPISIFYIYV